MLAVVLSLLLFLVSCTRRESTTTPTPPPPKHGDQAPKTLEATPTKEPVSPPVVHDLDAIRTERTLRVLFTFNSTGYFIYRGETLGYEYELARRFADEQKLTLKPVVLRDSSALISALNRGEGDIVAAQLIRPDNDPDVSYTTGLYETSPVLVQRKPATPAAKGPPAVANAIAREANETRIEPIVVRARLVTEPAELGGQRVDVPRSTPFRGRLLELNDELSDDIQIVEVDESSDRLIQNLAEGQIGYTVAAENLAALKASEYANLIIKPALGPPKQIAFAVRRNSPLLLDVLNRFIEKGRRSLLPVLYRKYFLDRRGFVNRSGSPYLTAETGRLSQFDDLFREYAKVPGWDWRLLAAQAFQESRFNPNARSWAGAVGLMQIMPRTARELRINPRDPRQAVDGASRYVWKLDQYWSKSVSREAERIQFILGSYNVGLGHVEDARRLASKHGDDPDAWVDVSYWLIRKSKREVYNDPVVRYGFARGVEPVTYVSQILQRFANYREFVKSEEEPPKEEPPKEATPETSGTIQ
jgi:membrane-bound lytic murein transglycosylase F